MGRVEDGKSFWEEIRVVRWSRVLKKWRIECLLDSRRGLTGYGQKSCTTNLHIAGRPLTPTSCSILQIPRHVFRRNNLAGHQPAVLLFQAQVRASPSDLSTSALTPPPDSIRRPKPSVETSTMSQAFAVVKLAHWQILATPPSARTLPRVLFIFI